MAYGAVESRGHSTEPASLSPDPDRGGNAVALAGWAPHGHDSPVRAGRSWYLPVDPGGDRPRSIDLGDPLPAAFLRPRGPDLGLGRDSSETSTASTFPRLRASPASPPVAAIQQHAPAGGTHALADACPEHPAIASSRD